MSNVLSFNRPIAAQRADGVMAAVNIAARRLGFRDEQAAKSAMSAKRAYLDGRGSAAGIVANYKAALRTSVEKVTA